MLYSMVSTGGSLRGPEIDDIIAFKTSERWEAVREVQRHSRAAAHVDGGFSNDFQAGGILTGDWWTI